MCTVASAPVTMAVLSTGRMLAGLGAHILLWHALNSSLCVLNANWIYTG